MIDRFKKFALVATFALALPLAGVAQVVSFLNIASDPAAQAMGGASVTASAGAFSAFNNASSIALSEEKCAAGVSYTMWEVADVCSPITSVGALYKFGDSFGIGVSYSGMAKPSIEIYDDQGNHKGDYSPSDSAIGLALAYAPVDKLSVGVTLKSISSKLTEDISGSSVGFDFSATYLLEGVTIGASYSNVGSISYGESLSYSLPSALRVGGSYEALSSGEHSCDVAAQLSMLTDDSTFGVSVGGEYSFSRMIFARAGYYVSGDESVTPNYLSVGVGAQYAGVSFDCSYVVDDVISPLSLSLSYQF